MNFDLLFTRMTDNAKRIENLVEGISVEQARWKPDPETWSILEVVNHLYDEERADFRVRLDIILHHPGHPAPPIDPQGWVTERQYNERDLKESLENFLSEREKSLDWLKGLSAPDWKAVYEAPFGQIKAGDMFAAWTAHDLLHMRQLVELHWAYNLSLVEPYQVDYAGSW
jgi:hypothetical protein